MLTMQVKTVNKDGSYYLLDLTSGKKQAVRHSQSMSSMAEAFNESNIVFTGFSEKQRVTQSQSGYWFEGGKK